MNLLRKFRFYQYLTTLSTSILRWFSGYPCTVTNALAQDLNDYQIYGNSKQEYITIDDVQYKVPDGYTILDYIESSGTQYIDTGVPLASTDNVKIKYQYLSTTTTPRIFGVYTLASRYMISESTTVLTSTIQVGWYDSWIPIAGTGIVPSTDIVEVEIKDGILYENGTSYATLPSSFSAGTDTAHLFTLGGDTTKIASARIYSCSIEGKRNLIPAKRKSDNTIGMYDFVTNTFFTNAGTGTFTAGNEAPNTDRPLDIVSVGDPILPSGYTQLEYIESTGTQYIDTGVDATQDFGIDIDFIIHNPISTSSHGTLFAAGTSTTAIWVSTYARYATGSFDFGTTVSTHYSAYITPESRMQISLRNGEYTTSTGGSVSAAKTAFDVGLNVFLFAANFPGKTLYECSRTTLYSCKIYNSNTLIRKFIPAKRNSDNEIGMYDTVNNVFYINQGTGSFTAGAESTTYQIPIKVNDILPSSYTQLEYIESTGTQYIDTGIVGVDKTQRWIIEVKNNSSANKTTLVSAGRADTVRSGYGVFIASNTWSTSDTASSITATGKQVIDATVTINTAENVTDTILVDNVSASSYTRAYDATHVASSTTLFAEENARQTGYASFGNFSMYNAKCYLDNTLVRNFIPAKRNSDSVIGMYDTVTDTFYTNAGTGTFTAGSEVGTITTTYISEPLRKVGEYTSLPVEYTQLEYIQSSGTQWLNTNKKPYEVGKWELDAQFTNIITSDAFNGNGSFPASNNRFDIGITNTGMYWLAIGAQNTTISADRNRHIFTLNRLNAKAYIDSTELTYSAVTWDNTATDTIYIGNRTYYVSGSSLIYACEEKIYSSKIWDNSGVLVQNLVPAKRNSDSVLGMYDTVSNTFFTNQGTGTFTAGPAIADYISYSDNKVIRNVAEIASYNGETISTSYISSTGSLTTGAQVVYLLATPTEETITAPTLTMTAGTDIITTNSTVSASDIKAQAYCSQ